MHRSHDPFSSRSYSTSNGLTITHTYGLAGQGHGLQWSATSKVQRRIFLVKGPKRMSDRIRQTNFWWNPRTETRSSAWNRIKHHVTDDLDRIQQDEVRRRRLARHQVSLTYERNASIYRTHLTGAVSDQALAKEYGLRKTRIREIIRAERHWSKVMAPLAGDVPGGLEHRPSRHLLSPRCSSRYPRHKRSREIHEGVGEMIGLAAVGEASPWG